MYVPYGRIAFDAMNMFYIPPCIPLINPCEAPKWDFPDEH